MAEAWTASRTANGINVIDENGLPVCTRVGLDDAKLIASAPLLQERVRILREAAQRVIDNWDSGDLADSVRELSLILEATKGEP